MVRALLAGSFVVCLMAFTLVPGGLVVFRVVLPGGLHACGRHRITLAGGFHVFALVDINFLLVTPVNGSVMIFTCMGCTSIVLSPLGGASWSACS